MQVVIIQSQVDLLATKTLEEADTIKKRNEHRLRLATMAGYVLYGLGWCLGLVGKLYGVESLVGE